MRMHPGDAPRASSSQAETHLFHALAQADLPGWEAWHSLRLRSGRQEGEGDFVVVAPDLGLLVLEVKGGQLARRDGRWTQNGKPLAPPPRDQAQGYVRKLEAALRAKGAPVPSWGVACAFPDCEFSDAPGGEGLEGLVVGQRDLPWLTQVLPALLRRALGRGPAPVTPRTVEALHALWGETWVPTVKLVDRSRDAQAERVRLDVTQVEHLDTAEENRRALVTGGAGTGKTILAVELARRHAARAEHVLFLCFTDGLARGLALEFAGAPSVTCRPVRQHALALLRASGQAVDVQEKDFWKQASARAAALPPPPPPGLVVVDEAQDFEPSDWALVERLAQGGPLWVFRGEGQAYWEDRDVPAALQAGMAKLRLGRPYRSPKAILDFAARYTRAGATLTAPLEAQPATLRRARAATPGDLAAVQRELDTLAAQGVPPNQVVVLTLTGQLKSHLFQEKTLGAHRLVHGDAPDAHQHTVVDTFLRFKGLERPFVVITELTLERMVNYDVRLHIALTRAQVAVVVVATDDEVAADARLALLPGP